MTTAAAAAAYLAEHMAENAGRSAAVFNPNGKPLAELPVIYGFNNGGEPGWYEAVAIAEDGTVLGGHTCSHESYIPADLGVLEGTRPDQHAEQYSKHYPNGYRMVFVPSGEIKGHAALNDAFRRNGEKRGSGQEAPE